MDCLLTILSFKRIDVQLSLFQVGDDITELIGLAYLITSINNVCVSLFPCPGFVYTAVLRIPRG